MGVRERMLVKDVMTSPVVTLDEDASVNEVARQMEQHRIGGVIVTRTNGKPLGIITERDLVVRVLTKSTPSSKLTAKDVMTSPLITVDPDETLIEATRRMRQLDVRRLGVMYRGNLVGIVSSKDILSVTPELIEIMQERARIEGVVEEEDLGTPLAGHCDQCGGWSDALKEVDGEFICEECRTERDVEY